MQSECIVFNGQTYRRYPDSLNRSDRVYYSRSEDGKAKRLHVALYEYYNGAIPEGYHIHHKDENPLNNNLDNLECIKAFDHISKHSIDYHNNNKERAINHLESIRELTKEWHRSKDGHEWHKAHPPKRVLSKYVCLYCKKGFETDKKSTNKFCSNKCRSAYRRSSGVDDEIRICPKCGKEFTANKYSDTKCCSKSCGKKK